MTPAGHGQPIPLADVSRQYRRCREAIDDAVHDVLASGQYILGPAVERFEAEFAAYLGVRHGVGVATGLDALRLCLVALGVAEGDEVIVPANTFAATALAVLAAGGTPVAADVDPNTANLTVVEAEKVFTSRTKAVMPVHLYGRACEIDALLNWAEGKGLVVLEDACQAHGAMAGDRRCGSLGIAGCFSFYPTKNLGAAGDGGFVATDDDRLARRLRELRNYGQSARYTHERGGTNSRLDSVQAALLSVKLRHLDEWNRERQEIAASYRLRLTGSKALTLAATPQEAAHVHHLFVVRHPAREALLPFLAERGVHAGIHYPVPIHRQPFYSTAVPGRLAAAEMLSAEVVSLPIFPGLTEEELERICQTIHAFDEQRG